MSLAIDAFTSTSNFSFLANILVNRNKYVCLFESIKSFKFITANHYLMTVSIFETNMSFSIYTISITQIFSFVANDLKINERYN